MALERDSNDGSNADSSCHGREGIYHARMRIRIPICLSIGIDRNRFDRTQPSPELEARPRYVNYHRAYKLSEAPLRSAAFQANFPSDYVSCHFVSATSPRPCLPLIFVFSRSVRFNLPAAGILEFSSALFALTSPVTAIGSVVV